MPSFNSIILLFLSVFLIGCSQTVVTESSERLTLDIQEPSPLKLEPLSFKIIILDETTYFALTEKDFQNLTINTERVQNRLKLQSEIIENQKNFYENQ